MGAQPFPQLPEPPGVCPPLPRTEAEGTTCTAPWGGTGRWWWVSHPVVPGRLLKSCAAALPERLEREQPVTRTPGLPWYLLGNPTQFSTEHVRIWRAHHPLWHHPLPQNVALGEAVPVLPAEAYLADGTQRTTLHSVRPGQGQPPSDPTGPMADMGDRSSVVGGNPGTLTEKRFIYITRSRNGSSGQPLWSGPRRSFVPPPPV